MTTFEPAAERVTMFTNVAPMPQEASVSQQAEAPAVPTWKKWAARLAMIGAVVGGSIGVEAATDAVFSQAAGKPTCYGDYCTGKYADQTGCDKDARTIKSTPIYQRKQEITGSVKDGPLVSSRDVKVGTLEVRGSKACGTEWGRAVINVPAFATEISIVQDETGHTQTRRIQRPMGIDAVRGTFYSPQVYTHNYAHQAELIGDEMAAYTDWAPGLRKQ